MSNIFMIIIVAIAAFILLSVVIPGRFMIPHIMIRPSSNPELEKQVVKLDYVIRESVEGSVRCTGFLMDQTTNDKVIIFFGGINESAAFSVNRFDEIRREGGYYDNYDIIVIDYPGYGNSEGKANVESLKKAVCDIVRKYRNIYSEVVIMGYSMGTGYATYAASVAGCDSLVLLAPYYSATDLVNNIIGIYRGPFERFLSYRLPVYEYAKDVQAPVLIVASGDDRRVPYASSSHLSEKFGYGCRVEKLYGISHAQLPKDREAVLSIREFLNKYAA